MARDTRNDSQYNGSAAYDLYRYNGSAAPEIQHPGLPEERPLPRKARRVKVKAAVSPFALVGMAVVICMLILVVFGYVQLYEATEQVSSLEYRLDNLKEEHAVLQSLYEGGIDLPYIEQRAAELGLTIPTGEQTVYLNLAGADRAEIYTEEKVGLLEKIVQAIKSSASGLVEYLS